MSFLIDGGEGQRLTEESGGKKFGVVVCWSSVARSPPGREGMRVGLLRSFCRVVVVLFRNFSGVLIDFAWFRLFLEWISGSFLVFLGLRLPMLVT